MSDPANPEPTAPTPAPESPQPPPTEAQAAAPPQSSGNAMIDMATNALDSDHDGSSLDDIASMAFNYIKNR